MPLRAVRALSLVGGWSVVGLSAAGLLAQLVGSPGTVAATLQAITPWMVPAALAATIGGQLVRRRALMTLAAGVSVAHLGLLVAVLPSGAAARPAAHATPFSVLSANVGYGNARLRDLDRRLEQLDADVVGLIEMTPRMVDDLDRLPAVRAYPYRAVSQRSNDILVLSRLPIAVVREEPIDRSLDVVVETADGDVRVLVVHVESPVVDAARWRRELHALGDVAAAASDPLIVAGDFNATWFHPPFRRFVDGANLADSSAGHGSALAMTWPVGAGRVPFVALDHVLLSSDLATVQADVVGLPGSDHRGVHATIAAADTR